MRIWHRALTTVAILAAAAVLAPAAMASVSGSMSLQQMGNSAGGFHDLGLTLTFNDNDNSDSPKQLTLALPAGLLANTAIDGGACLSKNLAGDSACEIGTGTVDVHPNLAPGLPILGGLPVPSSVPIQVQFYLVPPPASGDLAGLEVMGLGTQIGQTGQITIRPSGSTDGVGADVALALPNTLPASLLGPLSVLGNKAIGISIQEIASTFDSLRYPATCPSPAAPFVATFNSYDDAGSDQSLSQPLAVTDCGALSYDPKFSASATKDSSDDAVAVTTNITQQADEAPNRSVALVFPTTVFAPNLRALPELCLSSLSSCTPVGSVKATSPLYPTPLTGKAYLTGNSSGLSLTLAFPSPFPLTLVGSISLQTNTAAFSGLPDIPLTGLLVSLSGGARGLFATGCNPPTGTATATLSAQNGAGPRRDTTPISVVGCRGVHSSGGSSGGSGSGGSGSSGSGSSASSSTPTASVSGTRLRAQSISGLGSGRPSLRFTVSVTRHAAKFTRMTVMLPAGLALRIHRVHRRIVVRGVSVKGARIASMRVVDHHLVITLRRASRQVTVWMKTASLTESRHLLMLARHHRLTRLRLRVAVRDTRHRTRTLTVTVRHFRLT